MSNGTLFTRAALLCVAAVACASSLSCARTPTYSNPILFADYSDPDVIRSGNFYYLIASSFHFSPGIPILRSPDLVHWTLIGHVLQKLRFAPEYDLPGPFKMTDAATKETTGTRYAEGVWAPAIREHAGRFYVYWPTPHEGVFMASATTPEGPWSDPVCVIAQPNLEDPCPFWDDDGSAWLVHGKIGAGPLILHRMSPDGASVLDDGITIAEDKTNLPVLEGPKLYKRNGWYFIFAPIGGVDSGPEAVGRARDIHGPYQWRTVLQRGTTNIRGPHQGGYVETASGQGWFIHFNSTRAYGRIVYLEPVTWVDDWPIIGDPIPNTTAGQPVATHAMPDVGGTPADAQPQTFDEFTTLKLGPQWEWNHNPDDAAWSLTQRPGFLRLRALPSKYLVTARNTLTQILFGPEMTATARIDISQMTDGQRGGLAMFGSPPTWIGAVRQANATHIVFAFQGEETAGPLVTSPQIDLRVTVTADQRAQYSFSLDDGKSFQTLGDGVLLPRFSWWKGARPALFTYTTADTPGGNLDIDYFRVVHPDPPVPSPPFAASRFNILDTPVEELAADPGAKGILDKFIPGLQTLPGYDKFKKMSLTDAIVASGAKVSQSSLQTIDKELRQLPHQ